MKPLGDAVYRLMLLAFPAAFRQRHGAAMEERFEVQRRSLKGRPLALWLLWSRAAADAIQHGSALRRETGGLPRFGETVMAFTQDLGYAARRLRRDGAATAVIVLILTAGIAANAIMFGVVDQLLLRPPSGVGHAEAVRRVYFGSARPQRVARAGDRNSYPYVAAIRDHVPAFEIAAATSVAHVTIGAGADAHEAIVQMVDAEYFPLLEIRPGAGRFFTRSDIAVPDGQFVAVLSHSFWLREYAGDPRTVGQSLKVEGSLLIIVGVAQPGFAGIEAEPVDAWVPSAALAPTLFGPQWASSPGRYAFGLVARLAPGATSVLADTQATAAYRAAVTDMPMDQLRTAITAPLEGLTTPNGIPAVAKVALWLLGVAIVVLLVAVANVASMLVTRALSRRREIAVCLALGISRRRLLLQFLTESALLAGLAMIAALGVAYVGGRAVEQVLLPGFAWRAGVVDSRVLAVALVVSALATLGTGLVPALQGVSPNLTESLCSAPRIASGRTAMLRTGLLLAQVILSVLLLVGAGLFIRSLEAVRTHDVGLDLDRVVQVTLPSRAPSSKLEVEAKYAAAFDRLGQIPGVARIAIVRGSLPKGGSAGVSILPEGWDLTDLNGRTLPAYFVVGSDYFATVGATLDRGRGLTVEDERASDRVAVINRATAAEFWGNADPLGQCFRLGSDSGCTRVVGIVQNILLYSRANTDQPQLYIPPSHPFAVGRAPSGLLIRTEGDADRLVPTIRQVVQSVAPDMPFVPVNTLETLVAPELQPWRLGTTMFLLFGAVALVIAVVGLYASMAHAVSQRSHEIGVRMALGASRSHVVAEIARRGILTIAAGTALGLLVSAVATRWLIDLLYQTSPRDPLVFSSVALVLVIAGVAAAIVPALRSATIDPLTVLRTE